MPLNLKDPRSKLAVSWRDRGIWKSRRLSSLLGHELTVLAPGERPGSKINGVLGWGLRPSGQRARKLGGRHELPVWLIEDGFIRSLGLGRTDPPLSIVIDDLGIYYDASCPSRLEMLIAKPHDSGARARAGELVSLWRSSRVSKYNHAREYKGELPARYVLAVDQTSGDSSIRCGSADLSNFQRMLEAALAENPECTVLLKVHPDVIAGRKSGHFNLALASRNPRVKVIGEDAHPVRLIEHAEAVYVVTSQMGFEGLLWGKRVRTFGMPFYAGWGLTGDELPAPDRRRPVPLENLVHAALVEYTRYVDPETAERCNPERLISWMGLQRHMMERFPETIYALDFYPWKRPVVRDFFQGSKVRFVKRAEEVPDKAALAIWGRNEIPNETLRLIRLEDGFLRSVGLGANLVRPLSWVMDEKGIYYDAAQGSTLEDLLQTASFDPELLKRAAMLRKRIVEYGLTKYNIGATAWSRPNTLKKILLVPGQVENDASITFGAPGICRNIDLLRAVRDSRPEAYVIYKPHPDVVAGLRKSGKGEDEASRQCDEMVTDCPMDKLLEGVDEVHLMTSLSGFEALIRGKKIVTYGQPFYAGWGLTDDRYPVAGRKRKLSLDELVAGVLILYPAYVSRTTGRFTTPERALDELLAWRSQGPSGFPPFWRRLYLKLLEFTKNHVFQNG